MLVDSFEFLDQALDEKRKYATHLGGNVYSTVKATGIYTYPDLIWISPFRFESPCALDCGMNYIASKGGTIFGRRGAGNYFTMSHTATRGSS
jgi:hypothetical protein